MAYVAQTFTINQILTAAQMNQVETNIKDHVHGDGTTAAAFTALSGGALSSFTADTLVMSAYAGILETNANFVAMCLVGPAVDGMPWAGLFENGSVWASLMLATVETSGADAELNIWDLTNPANITGATPLATVTLTGATPTRIAAAMGYIIIGTSDQGAHFVDPHSGAWAERTAGWPKKLSTATTPDIVDNHVRFVCAGFAQQPPRDPLTGGFMPCFGVAYGAGAAGYSLIKHNGKVHDRAETVTSGAPIGIANGYFYGVLESTGDSLYRSTTPIDGITADAWTRANIFSTSELVQFDAALDMAGRWGVGGDAGGATIFSMASYAGAPSGLLAEITRAYNTGFQATPGAGVALIAYANSVTADRSGQGTTLTENGTIPLAAIVTGAELQAAGPFSSTNYGSRAYDAVLNLSTVAWTIEGWFITTGTPGAQQSLLDRGRITAHDSNPFYEVRLNTTGQLNFQAQGSGGISNKNFGPTGLADQVPHKFCIVHDGAAKRDFYVDGRWVDTDSTAVGDLDDGTTPVLQLGYRCSAANAADATKLALVHITVGAKSEQDIADTYKGELPMTLANSKCLLQSATTDAILDGGAQIDRVTGDRIFTQTDSQTVWAGLAIKSTRTIAAGGTTFEHGLGWNGGFVEINNANLYATVPADDQKQVNEMVRSLANKLPAGADLSKAKAWVVDTGKTTSTISGSLNIVSGTRDATGVYTYVFAVPFKTDNYVVTVIADGELNYAFINTKTRYQCTLRTRNEAGADSNSRLSAVFFGELENE